MSDPAAQAAVAAAIAAAVRTFNTELWTFYAFGVLITIVRTYARVKAVGIRDLRADDFIVWLAILLYTAQSTLAYFAVNHGQGLANNAMTDAERAALSPDSTEYRLRVFGSKIQVVGWTTYACLICTLKIAVLVFYIRLMEGLSNYFRIRIWIGFGLVGLTFVASVITIYGSCQPFSNYWQINPDPGNSCQGAVASPIVWVTFASSVVTDLYLIMVPLPMLWGTSLKLVKKLAATFVLGAGVFVLICSLLKTIFVTTDPVHGAQLAGEWGTREAFVSVVTTNLPMIFPLLKSWLKPLFGSALSSTGAASKHPSGFRTIGGGGGSSGVGQRRKPTSSKQPVTDSLSFSESAEHIVNSVKMQNLEGYTGLAAPTRPPSKGIMVSNEFKMVEDGISHKDGRDAKQVHESW
ncbi:uncharacterized protein K444DRAFT_610027 [Hyaloscypha bicolor E]|uniref:Rhodopsin domain-containing protein n=1 Tax=Hyaloscypha bicolor E TaxID=1095630 RepID=A0A2J6TJG1_9HELO|nr:uncharacterized protein K444DRAFT_610027 [Hyaloscypha bicolor E]PMD63159.1 hypothetical protein K444DRAFT_610027 [Hyaloscypha bicolor E]